MSFESNSQPNLQEDKNKEVAEIVELANEGQVSQSDIGEKRVRQAMDGGITEPLTDAQYQEYRDNFNN